MFLSKIHYSDIMDDYNLSVKFDFEFDENIDNYDFTKIEDIAEEYELLSSEELEDYFKRKGE